MNPIKNLFSSTMVNVDNGQVLKKPVKWLFIFIAFLQFVLPLFVVALLVYNWRDLSYSLGMFEGWEKFCGFLFITLFIIYLFVVAYILFLFWKNRANRLAIVCPNGSSNTAVRLCAYYNQCQGESVSIILAFCVPVSVIFVYLYFMLTGAMHFYHDGYFLIALLVGLGIILLAFLVAYFNLLWCHFISEFMSMIAKISDDVSDLTDIHRAATVSDQQATTGVE